MAINKVADVTDEDIKKLEAEQAAAIAERAKKEAEAPKNPDQPVLDLLKEGKGVEVIADRLGMKRDEIIKIAYSNMNNESVYELAERLGVKVNDIYRITMPEMVRRITVKEDGENVVKEFDYEA